MEDLGCYDIDLDKDGDLHDGSRLAQHFQQQYSCVSRKSIGLQKLYILHLDAHWKNDVVACALSNHSVHVASISSLTKINTFIAHEDTIVGVRFLPESPDQLVTASNGGCVRMWDIRTPKNPCSEFKGDSTGASKPLASVDVNIRGQMLCAGTEKIKKEDAHLLFWDIRSSKQLGCFSDSHEDDITHVRFHPTESHTLASCSTDGLINIFDTNQSEEDESLQYSLNSETSCSHLQWLRPIKSIQSLSVVTHTEGLQIWTIDEASPLHSFSREQIKDALLRRKAETVYTCSCFQLDDEENPLVLAGSTTPRSGCLRLLQLQGNQLKPYAMLNEQGQSSQIVRCAALNRLDGGLITAGEDGIINVWRRGEGGTGTSATAADLKVKVGKKSKLHSKKPYS